MVEVERGEAAILVVADLFTVMDGIGVSEIEEYVWRIGDGDALLLPSYGKLQLGFMRQEESSLAHLLLHPTRFSSSTLRPQKPFARHLCVIRIPAQLSWQRFHMVESVD